MKNKKPNAAQVWKQFEDLLAPRLRMSVVDRAVYSHLVRHSRLEGKVRLRFSILWMARAIRITGGPIRESVRRLVNHGALRLVERSKRGHVVDVRLPEEIRAVHLPGEPTGAPGTWANRRGTVQSSKASAAELEEMDFLQTKERRDAIHAREGGHCFYCVRRLRQTMKCIDHVVPRAQLGRNSYRNLVSSCLECNSRKGEKPAADFLRLLYREGRLTGVELMAHLRAVEALAAGKLVPSIQSQFRK